MYLNPTPEHEASANDSKPDWKPENELIGKCRDQLPLYGMNSFSDLFTPRQLVALTTFSDLVGEARERARRDAVASGMRDDGVPLRSCGDGATAYAEAIGTYLGFTLDRLMQQFSTISVWSSNPAHELVITMFSRQAIPMTWDYGEINPFCTAASWEKCLSFLVKVVEKFGNEWERRGIAVQEDAQSQERSLSKIVSTDPPYYDNISYADLSDFFYVWLRRSLQSIFPDLFATLAVPKEEELIAAPYRHGGSKVRADFFFMVGMTRAAQRLADQTHPAFPVTIYYAFKQSEKSGTSGITSTGWETFLSALIGSGFSIRGTWPMRTERPTGMKTAVNALASSVVLVCRARAADAPTATLREFLEALKSELPEALRKMQQGNIAPVDLAQAAIGPGMAIFTSYARVLGAGGEVVTVREALALINETLDEALAEQEGDFDADTRWALAWFDQSGFSEGEYGVAETLSLAKNTSVAGMVEAGILTSGAGKVRLLAPAELSQSWDSKADSRRTVWETTHQLVRVHSQGGDAAAADIMANIGADAETARDLAYRLFRICDLRNRPQEALGYNALVRSWGEISGLATQARQVETQGNLLR